jgi:hypothetical protein
MMRECIYRGSSGNMGSEIGSLVDDSLHCWRMIPRDGKVDRNNICNEDGLPILRDPRYLLVILCPL